MSIKEIHYFRCTCDKCGNILENVGEHIDFDNMKEIIHRLDECGWKVVEIHNTGKKVFLCCNCAGVGLIQCDYFNKNIVNVILTF